jgi:hypothetical protein
MGYTYRTKGSRRNPTLLYSYDHQGWCPNAERAHGIDSENPHRLALFFQLGHHPIDQSALSHAGCAGNPNHIGLVRMGIERRRIGGSGQFQVSTFGLIFNEFQLLSLHFTIRGLWQVIDKLDFSWILVHTQTLFNKILYLRL